MNVLFVCNGNVARSQEAEAFFTALMLNSAVTKSGQEFQVASAGVEVRVGRPLDPLVLEVMREAGYEMTHATRKLLTSSMVEEADLVVSFKPRDELPDFVNSANNNATNSAKEFRYWPVPDPRGQSVEFHRENRDRIEKLVRELVLELADH